MNKRKSIGMFILILLMISTVGCASGNCFFEKKQEVVIYTAVEQVYCEQLFAAFEEKTGITVKAVYDTEANKTTGLVNRLIAEEEAPVCDVFWNNEFIQTISLQEKGLLDVYVSEAAADIPEAFKDDGGYWTAIGGRTRVILVNSELLDTTEYPSSIYDFVNGHFEGEELAFAYPAFGTTKTQIAAMYARLGAEEGRNFLLQMKDLGVQIVDGNSVTKDMVAAGQVVAGYTDTDDAKDAIKDGYQVEIVYPDQGEDEIGTLITPSTVALVKGAPHSEYGKLLIDFIVSRESEEAMVACGFFDTSVRSGSDFAVKGMNLKLREIYDMLEIAANDVEEIFITAQ